MSSPVWDFCRYPSSPMPPDFTLSSVLSRNQDILNHLPSSSFSLFPYLPSRRPSPHTLYIQNFRCRYPHQPPHQRRLAVFSPRLVNAYIKLFHLLQSLHDLPTPPTSVAAALRSLIVSFSTNSPSHYPTSTFSASRLRLLTRSAQPCPFILHLFPSIPYSYSSLYVHALSYCLYHSV